MLKIMFVEVKENFSVDQSFGCNCSVVSFMYSMIWRPKVWWLINKVTSDADVGLCLSFHFQTSDFSFLFRKMAGSEVRGNIHPSAPFLQLKQCHKCALEHTIAGVNVKAGNGTFNKVWLQPVLSFNLVQQPTDSCLLTSKHWIISRTSQKNSSSFFLWH